MFQYMARHSPLKAEDLASVVSQENQQDKLPEVEMSDWREERLLDIVLFFLWKPESIIFF